MVVGPPETLLSLLLFTLIPKVRPSEKLVNITSTSEFALLWKSGSLGGS